jgi:hypothetical protein
LARTGASVVLGEAAMAEVLEVFGDLNGGWSLPLISRKKYLTVPKVDVTLRQPLPPDVEKKQKDILVKAYSALFDKQLQVMSNAHFAKVQAKMDAVESTIDKLKSDPAISTVQNLVDDINDELKSEVDKWKAKVGDLHADCYAKALAQSDAAMKKKVTRERSKVRAIATVVGLVTLGAAAVVIVSAATAGAAPLAAAVAGAIIAGIGALVNTIIKFKNSFKSAWKLCQDKIAEIEEEIETSQNAYAELRKLNLKSDDQKSLYEKARAQKDKIVLASKNIDAHVDQLEKYCNNFNTKLKEYQAALDALEKQADDMKRGDRPTRDPQTKWNELQVLIDEQNERIVEMNKRLAAVAEVRQAAAKIVAQIKDSKGVPDYPGLRKAVDPLRQALPVVSDLVAGAASIVSAAPI